MLLGRGERLVLQGGAELSSGDSWIAGALYLSNYRVLFEAGAGGANPYTAYGEELERIWNVHAGKTSTLLGGAREFLTIEGQRGRRVFRVGDSQRWATAIAHSKATLPPPPPPPPPAQPAPRAPAGTGPGGYPGVVPVVVNIPAPAAPQVMMHCRHCGNLYDATKGRCDRCGAPPA